jgi:protocatechuate 3,4-dioxygenase beta subunit
VPPAPRSPSQPPRYRPPTGFPARRVKARVPFIRPPCLWTRTTTSRVEIWQCNAFGRYHHPRDRRDAPIDENFQAYGRSTTGGDGLYRFRTIRPVHYPGRTPHIHFAVSGPGIDTLVTQMYVAGEPRNASDGLLNSVSDASARARLIVELLPVPGSSDALMGRFDLVLAADGRFGRIEPGWLEGILEGYRRRV